MSSLQFVGKRKMTDLDRVTAFARMIYGEKNAPHSLLPLWMHYLSVGEYLYDRGVPLNTVYGGILQGLYYETFATTKDLVTFGKDIKDFIKDVPPIIQGSAMLYSSHSPTTMLKRNIKSGLLTVSVAHVYLGTHYVKIVRAARHVVPMSKDFLDNMGEAVITLTTSINDTLLDDIAEDLENAMYIIKRKQVFV